MSAPAWLPPVTSRTIPRQVSSPDRTIPKEVSPSDRTIPREVNPTDGTPRSGLGSEGRYESEYCTLETCRGLAALPPLLIWDAGDAREFLRESASQFDFISTIKVLEHIPKQDVLGFLDLIRACVSPMGRWRTG